MSNTKQTDIAELAIKEYPFSNSERNAFIAGYNKAKEMEKKKIILSIAKNLPIEDGVLTAVQKAEQYYNETFGGNNEQ